MSDQELTKSEELRAIDRERNWILATSIMAVLVLVVIIAGAPSFGAPFVAVIVASLLIVVALKKAATRFRALGERKAALVDHL